MLILTCCVISCEFAAKTITFSLFSFDFIPASSEEEVSFDIFLDQTAWHVVAYRHVAVKCTWVVLKSTWIGFFMAVWGVFDDLSDIIVPEASVFCLSLFNFFEDK